MKLAVSQRIPKEWNREVMASLIRDLENQVNQLAEGRIEGRHFAMTSAPTAGSFKRGDIIWNSEPSAAGTVGWVCVSSGSPGTFKTFGTIAS